jgi:small subunit ribosomal protein S3Ae
MLIIICSAHSFAKKEWYNVHVPTVFDVRTPTITPCNRTAGQKIAADSLKGRVFEISLADLNRDSNEQAWRKMKVQIEEVKGFDCYTNFYGMDITRDKLCTIVKKWHTTVEAFVQTKTADGYLLRMFCIGFTKRTSRQVRATCYAKGSQRKLIRKKMMEIMINEAQKSTLKELTKKLYVIYMIPYIFEIIVSRTPSARPLSRSARRSSPSRTCS